MTLCSSKYVDSSFSTSLVIRIISLSASNLGTGVQKKPQRDGASSGHVRRSQGTCAQSPEEKEEFKDEFEEWVGICEQADLITKARRSLEETSKRSFKKDGSFTDETERTTMNVCEQLWDMSQSNETKTKNFMCDWDMVSLWPYSMAGENSSMTRQRSG